MDDRIISSPKSLVGDEDRTDDSGTLVWIYSSACYGKPRLFFTCGQSSLITMLRPLYTRCTTSVSVRNTLKCCGKRFHRSGKETLATLLRTCHYSKAFSKSQHALALLTQVHLPYPRSLRNTRALFGYIRLNR